MCACALLVSLSSCYPQASDPAQLRLAHEQNAALRQETEAKLRVIELQDRLDAFRAHFRMLQNETTNLHRRS